MRYSTTDVNSVLASCIDMTEIIKSHPELLKIKSLASHHKVILLQSDNQDIIDLVVKNLDANDTYAIVTSMGKAFLKKYKLELTKDHIEKLDNRSYASLLKTDIKKYYVEQKWKDLPNYAREEIFLIDPEYFFKNNLDMPKITRSILYQLKASVVESYIPEEKIASAPTEYLFWNKMITYKPEIFKPMFIRCMKTMSNATEIRSIFYSHPDLVKMLKTTDIENCKLSLKQWVLLFNTIVSQESKRANRGRGKAKPSVFDGWTFDPTFVSDMELGLTLEMLNGKSKVSKQFQNAMSFLKTLKTIEENEDEDEAEAVE